MFYAQFVLSKRGPLAKIWLAAHWDKKLTKAHIFETDLEDSVENIISPQVKIALRTSGHLLLGVVRIYNRKAKYLLADCNEAFVKIKMAFRPGVVDLPEENREAQHNQIYLVEEFHPFDVPLPDITDFDMNRHQTLNQSRIDEITMPEEVPTTLCLEEGFGGEMLGYEEKDVTENFTTEDFQNMFYKDGDGTEKDDGLLGDHMGLGGGDENELLGRSFLQGNGLFGEVPKGGLFGDPLKSSVLEKEQEMEVDRDNNQIAFEPSSPPVVEDVDKSKDQESILMPQITDTLNKTPTNETILAEPALDTTLVQNETLVNEDQTTIIANTEEAFVLGPLDVTGVRDLRIRRKRKLIVDHMIELDGQTMREQLKDFKDIITTMDMAPPTKKLMQWKEIGGVDKLFSRPCKVMADAPMKYFTANLHTFVPEDINLLPEMEMDRHFKDQSVVDISMISNEVSRDDHNQNRILHGALESSASHSILSQGKDPSMHQFNVAGYTSDDNGEPVSVGPPSVGSNFEDSEMMLPANPLPNDLIMSALDVNPPESIDNLFPTGSPNAEDNENQAYADDVDDLRWNKRTQHLLRSLQRSFKHEHEVSFFKMTDGLNKKQAVSKFYSLLVLAKQEATNLRQFETFGDVSIQKGPKFDAILM